MTIDVVITFLKIVGRSEARNLKSVLEVRRARKETIRFEQSGTFGLFNNKTEF